MHTRRTLYLDPSTWDLTLDETGQIAVAREDYATMQSVSNEVRLWTNDAYFQAERGIPYVPLELGQPSENTVELRSYVRTAAGRVEDVREIRSVEITSFDVKTRTLSGSVTFTTIGGAQSAAITTYF